MMQHFDGSIETERRSEAASCIFHIKRDTTDGTAGMNDQDRERLLRDLSDALDALQKNESLSGLDSLADRLINLGKSYAFDASLIRSAVSRKDTGAIRVQLIQVLNKLERGKY